MTIGPNSIVEAAQIGLGVEIGKDCIIVRTGYNVHSHCAEIRQGKFVIIKDLAVILPGTVLPEATVIPPMTIWGGNPGQPLFESWLMMLRVSRRRTTD